MNLPKKIKIGGQFYNVVYDAKMVAKHNNKGEMDPVDNEIRVDLNMVKSQQEQTFIHEVIEALNSDYPLKLEHVQIELLDALLYQVIIDNPGIFNFKA